MVVVRDDLETGLYAAFSDDPCIGGCLCGCGNRGGAFYGDLNAARERTRKGFDEIGGVSAFLGRVEEDINTMIT